LLYVIIAIPLEFPVTVPFVETVATVVLLEVQGFVEAAFPVPVNVTFDPTQIEDAPVMVGKSLTLIVMVLAQPFVLV